MFKRSINLQGNEVERGKLKCNNNRITYPKPLMNGVFIIPLQNWNFILN